MPRVPVLGKPRACSVRRDSPSNTDTIGRVSTLKQARRRELSQS